MKSGNIVKLVLTLLICVFVCGIFAGAQEQRTETWTNPTPLPVPRVVKDRPLVLGYMLMGLTAESQQRWYWQTKIECAHRGWKLIEIVDATTAELQRTGFENLINQDVDAIIATIPMEGVKDLIIKAREKGIGVYCVDFDLRDGLIVHTTQPNGVVGAQMVYYGLGRLKEVGNALILNLTTHILRQRCYAAKGLLENEWPNLKLVGFHDLKSPGSETDAFDATQNYLTRFDNDLQWIFAGWDIAGIFAARAIEEAGLTRDECFVTGIDGGTQAYAEIRKGSPFTATLTQCFEVYTHVCCEVIDEVQIKGIAPGDPGSMVPADRTIYNVGVLTTPENAPASGTSIHELFLDDYYDPDDKDAWYFWGEPYTVQ